MKKHHGLLIILILLVSCSEQAKELYVSPSGSDDNPGTSSAPYQSIEKARDAIINMKQAGKYPEKGVQVILKEGNYKINNSIQFGASCSGEKDAPVTFTSAPGEKAVITGAITIKASEAGKLPDNDIKKSIQAHLLDSIRVINLTDYGITDFGELEQFGYAQDVKPAPIEFAYNNVPMQISRWPNHGYVNILEVIDPGSEPRYGDTTRRGGKFTYDYNRASTWKNTSDIWLHGFFAHGYPDDNLKVEHLDTINKTIKVLQPHLYGIKSSLTGAWDANTRRYYVFNLPEEIDMPGEYYLDRKTGDFYFYPPSNPESSLLQVALNKKPLFDVSNAKNIKFKGLIFENSLGIGFYSEKSENITIEDCIFRNFTTVAISFGQGVAYLNHPEHEFTGTPESGIIGNFRGHLYENIAWNRHGGKNCSIINCKVYNTGAGGIYIDGGDRKTLEPANHLIKGCEFTNTSTRYVFYCPSVLITGVGTQVETCYFHDIEQQAIFFHGNEHVINDNIFKNICYTGGDIGVIYNGRNPAARGTIIKNNYFQDIGSEGFQCTSVYLDDMACGTTVTHNVFRNAASGEYFPGILMNCGSYNTIDNNVFIDTKRAAIDITECTEDPWVLNGVKPGGIYHKRLLAVNYKQPPYAGKYKRIEHFMEDNMPVTRENIAKNNIFVRTRAFSTRCDNDSTKYIMPNNYFTSDENIFTNPDKGDFSIKEEIKDSLGIDFFKPVKVYTNPEYFQDKK